jgi:hypothetical protein
MHQKSLMSSREVYKRINIILGPSVLVENLTLVGMPSIQPTCTWNAKQLSIGSSEAGSRANTIRDCPESWRANFFSQPKLNRPDQLEIHAKASLDTVLLQPALRKDSH